MSEKTFLGKKSPYHWAVFDERGMMWTDTVRTSRNRSIRAWTHLNGAMVGDKWSYWRRAGYTCDKIKILRVAK